LPQLVGRLLSDKRRILKFRRTPRQNSFEDDTMNVVWLENAVSAYALSAVNPCHAQTFNSAACWKPLACWRFQL
jgi:hypothetical protein